jgi:hypothetical protein
VVLVALWLAGVGYIVWQSGPGSGPPLCVFRRFTGVPCPTCGTTRAVLAVGSGRVVEAVLLNPFVTIAGAVGGAWLALRVIAGRRVRLHLGVRTRRVALAGLVVLFIVNWCWVIWRELG